MSGMKIVLAFDKFKGAFSAAEACSAAAEGIASCHRRTDCIQIPIADGGEGTAEVICEVLGGAWHGLAVNDPLGRMVEVEFAVVDQGDGRRTAVMEMSAASGLWRVSGEDLDPWRASTYGTGEMIAAAAKMGVDKILIGIGGSATNDGGSGMAYGLGVQFLDKTGSVIVKLPEKLTYSDNINTLNIISLPEIVVACDVTNPLLGERGATRIYGAQKGVSEKNVLTTWQISSSKPVGMTSGMSPEPGPLEDWGSGCSVSAGHAWSRVLTSWLRSSGWKKKLQGLI